MRRPSGVTLSLLLVLTTLGAIAVVALGLAANPTEGSRPPAVGFSGLTVGVVANALDDDAARQAKAVERLGARWMREELRWSDVEPRAGAFRPQRFDRVMRAAAKRGIRVLPLLIQSPSWVSRERLRIPTDLGPWQEFVRLVMRRYGAGGVFWRQHPELDGRLAPNVWEIWNEPYFKEFSRPSPDPVAYAKLVRATVQAGRGVSGSARFLVAAGTGYQAADGSRRDWLRDVLDAVPGLGAYIDALAVHPYSPGSPRSTSVTRDSQFGRIDDLQRTLTDFGIRPKPLWITELGWSTCTQRPACSTPAQQRQFFTEALQLIAGRYDRQVEAIFAYRLTDLGAGPQDFQAGFGLIGRDGRRKPAWSVIQRAALKSRRARSASRPSSKKASIAFR